LVEFPIDPVSVAKLNNLEILNMSFKDNHVLGVVSNKYKIIGIEENLSYEKRQFVIAHELGHFLLNHMNETKNEIKFYKTDLDNTSYCSNKEDSEANFFADCLLMPQVFIVKVFEIYKKYTDSKPVIISGMAEQFSVPKPMLIRRLAALGLME
jgi:Zn-dependent peptidase ImmA (M78 family)